MRLCIREKAGKEKCKRTVVCNISDTRSSNGGAPKAKGLCNVVHFGPLARGERRRSVEDGGDGDKGNSRVTTKEVGRGCDPNTNTSSIQSVLCEQWDAKETYACAMRMPTAGRSLKKPVLAMVSIV